MSIISDTAFAMIVAEGQLENAIKEERRWRLRRQEAEEQERSARQQVVKYQRMLIDLQRNLCSGDTYANTGSFSKALV